MLLIHEGKTFCKVLLAHVGTSFDLMTALVTAQAEQLIGDDFEYASIVILFLNLEVFLFQRSAKVVVRFT